MYEVIACQSNTGKCCEETPGIFDSQEKCRVVCQEVIGLSFVRRYGTCRFSGEKEKGPIDCPGAKETYGLPNDMGPVDCQIRIRSL